MRRYGRYGRMFEYDSQRMGDLYDDDELGFLPEFLKQLVRKAKMDEDLAKMDEDLAKDLSKAIHLNNVEDVKMLLQAGADPNWDKENNGGHTYLLLAAYKGNPEIVEMLLQAGADPNTETVDDDYCPLVAAMFGENENPEVVKILLEYGAEVDPDNIEMMDYIIDHNLDYLIK